MTARPRSIVVATTNRGKLREFERLLRPAGWEVRGLADFPEPPVVEEDGATFAANALKKAQAHARHVRGWALADDSGLEVDALDGAPGVLSARYAGPACDPEANIDLLLRALAEVDDPQRTARFRCALALAAPQGESMVVEGVCEGSILRQRRGAGGFGYDPVFLYPPANRTFAEMTAAEKDAVSHRGQALARLRRRLDAFLGGEPEDAGGAGAALESRGDPR